MTGGGGGAESEMAQRTKTETRAAIDATLTLRLTQQDRALLHQLVALRTRDLQDSGVEVTAASYVRGLIRHEARLAGLLDGEPRKSTRKDGKHRP